MKQSSPTYLKHHFLIAMPHMADPNFAQTVTYLVEHNEQGAMGLVINRPSGLNLAEVLEQLAGRPAAGALPAHRHLQRRPGADRPRLRPPPQRPELPVDPGTGRAGDVHLSGRAVRHRRRHRPEKSLISLGYAGWEAGQLEAELSDNAWLTCPADPAILFDLPAEERLSAAAARLGVNLSLLTAQAGHA